MTLEKITNKYAPEKQDKLMFKSVEILSPVLEEYVPEEEHDRLMRCMYALIVGKHYNQEFAEEDTEKMYYKENGKNVYAPYWGVSEVRQVYDKVKSQLDKDYNFWDFYVTLNMIKSDMHNFIEKNFPKSTEDEKTEKYIELAVDWLNDEDNPFGEHKIWCYLNSK